MQEESIYLQQKVDRYPTPQAMIDSIDVFLIQDLIDANGLDLEITPKVIQGMTQYVKDSEEDGLTRDLETIKGDFLDTGYEDDDFRMFYFNELFSNDELAEKYLGVKFEDGE